MLFDKFLKYEFIASVYFNLFHSDAAASANLGIREWKELNYIFMNAKLLCIPIQVSKTNFIKVWTLTVISSSHTKLMRQNYEL